MKTDLRVQHLVASPGGRDGAGVLACKQCRNQEARNLLVVCRPPAVHLCVPVAGADLEVQIWRFNIPLNTRC
jgi:hypothetical protein